MKRGEEIRRLGKRNATWKMQITLGFPFELNDGRNEGCPYIFAAYIYTETKSLQRRHPTRAANYDAELSSAQLTRAGLVTEVILFGV